MSELQWTTGWLPATSAIVLVCLGYERGGQPASCAANDVAIAAKSETKPVQTPTGQQFFVNMSEDDASHDTDDGEANVFTNLTEDVLDAKVTMDMVRSPSCGAIVLFAGTTRDNFQGKPVKHLAYSSYKALALRTMQQVASEVKAKHQVHAIAIVHRLGVVPIGEESILIAVSSPHRHAAWTAAEEALELVKERVEIWKLEEFGGEEGGVWRANRDGQGGIKIS